MQGLGAALVVPTTLAIIMATFKDARERTSAIGIWTAIGAMALAFGPLIGGFISQHFHWGWIFFINVPVGIIDVRDRARGHRGESRDPSVRAASGRPRPDHLGRGAVLADLRADRRARQGLDLGR